MSSPFDPKQFSSDLEAAADLAYAYDDPGTAEFLFKFANLVDQEPPITNEDTWEFPTINADDYD